MTQKSKEFLSVEKIFRNLHKKIMLSFSCLDGKSVLNKTRWRHKSGGGGLSCEISNGKIIEKGMVNFSSIEGKVLPNSALAKKTNNSIKKFLATGVSVVIHPCNPFVPCSHLNVRYFETDKKDQWWFGGGFDLTPYFIYEDDVKIWHSNTKDMCDKYDKGFYKKFAKQCDEYFYLKHRNERRGIGGIFFDNLHSKDKEFYKGFTLDVGKTYLTNYLEIINKRHKKKYNNIHKEFQCIRRGRYVEFNLLYDRGTIFGLQSGGRADSILMSMPPNVKWYTNKKNKIMEYEKKLIQFL
tara:strand:- start:551 stop:1435 length:885 start_codon:yes stop_codon:yes gene_type:complete